MGMNLICILLFKLCNDIQTLSTCVLKLLRNVIWLSYWMVPSIIKRL